MKLNMEFGLFVRTICVLEMNDRPTMLVIHFVHGKFAVTGENLSLGFLTSSCSNQSAHLKRLARIM